MDTKQNSDQAVAELLERFIRKVGRVPDDDPDFTHQAHLFRSGYLDSVGVVQLIDYIEVDLKLELNDEELSDPDFVTIDGISAIVSTRIRDRAADDSRRST